MAWKKALSFLLTMAMLLVVNCGFMVVELPREELTTVDGDELYFKERDRDLIKPLYIIVKNAKTKLLERITIGQATISYNETELLIYIEPEVDPDLSPDVDWKVMELRIHAGPEPVPMANDLKVVSGEFKFQKIFETPVAAHLVRLNLFKDLGITWLREDEADWLENLSIFCRVKGTTSKNVLVEDAWVGDLTDETVLDGVLNDLEGAKFTYEVKPPMFRKNVSKEPDTETTKAKIEVLTEYVPARRANGDLAEIVHYDAYGEIEETRTQVKPLVAVYAEEQIGYEIPAIYDDPEVVGDEMTRARDTYAAVSLDEGATWKRTNLSRSADRSSFTLEDGTVYYGDTHKPNIKVQEGYVMVGWTSKFARSGTPTYAMDTNDDGIHDIEDIWGVSGPQRSKDYTDDGFEGLEIPFSAVWICRGFINDEGTMTWFKSERLTSARRDAAQITIASAKGAGFGIVWQEDPEGLRPGEQAGPGEGWSGATTNHKTDIWYSYIGLTGFETIDTDYVPNGDPQYDEEEEKGGNRPKAQVQMTLPVRLSDNDTLNNDSMRIPEGLLEQDPSPLNPDTPDLFFRVHIDDVQAYFDLLEETAADLQAELDAIEQEKLLLEEKLLDLALSLETTTETTVPEETTTETTAETTQPSETIAETTVPEETTAETTETTISEETTPETTAPAETTAPDETMAPTEPTEPEETTAQTETLSAEPLDAPENYSFLPSADQVTVSGEDYVPESTDPLPEEDESDEDTATETTSTAATETDPTDPVESTDPTETTAPVDEPDPDPTETTETTTTVAETTETTTEPEESQETTAQEPLADLSEEDVQLEMAALSAELTALEEEERAQLLALVLEALENEKENDGDGPDIDGSHAYGLMEGLLWDEDQPYLRFYQKINNQGVTKYVAITLDERLLDGDTGASRANLMLQPYKLSDGSFSAWAILGYEETKGAGSGAPDHTDHESGTGSDDYDPDLGKNVIYHSYDFRVAGTSFADPDYVIDRLVAGGAILNPQERDAEGNLLYLLAEDLVTPIYDFLGNPVPAYENARRPRFLVQGKTNATAGKAADLDGTVMVTVYKMGENGKGRPSDIMMQRWEVCANDKGNPYDIKFLAEEIQNISAVSPTEDGLVTVYNDQEEERVKMVEWEQTEFNLDDGTSDYDNDDARAHRGFLRGDFLAVAYTWTPNWTAARNGNDVYNLYIRRSFDGGKTWTTDPTGSGVTQTEIFRDPITLDRYEVTRTIPADTFEPARNLSLLRNTQESVIEPRLVGVPGTISGSPFTDEDTQDPNSFWVTYGTENNTDTNIPKDSEDDEESSGPLDLYYSYSTDLGETYYTKTKMINPDSDGNNAGEIVTVWDWLAKDTGNYAPAQAECQIRMSPDGSVFYAIWNESGLNKDGIYESDAMFRRIERDAGFIVVNELATTE